MVMFMYIKRSLCILLCLILLIGILAGCGAEMPSVSEGSASGTGPSPASTPEESTELSPEDRIDSLSIVDSWKQELYFAAYMGLPLDKLAQETVTGEQMTELLDAWIAYEAPEMLSVWQSMYPAFRSYTEPLPRIDVQSMIFLAIQFLGNEYTSYSLTVDNVNRALVDISFNETCDPTWSLYGTVDNFDFGIFGIDHFGVGGTYLNHVSRSPVSGEPPLAYDAQKNSYRMKDNASFLDAALAIARSAAIVHEDMFEYVICPEEQKILDLAAARKEAIFNAASEWAVNEGGKVYYVSPSGDDSNDGLSPETAWQTLGKVNSASIIANAQEMDILPENIDPREYPSYQWALDHPGEWAELNPGDVVLFERGGVWRGNFVTAEGVTYSAYGEGDKPAIYGSPENGSGAEKWTLLEGTDNIWVFYKELQDCGGILLDGKTVAQKYAPFWNIDAEKWLDFNEKESCTIAEALSAPEFDVKTLGNLRFFNALEDITEGFPGHCWGSLYLRCDAGNPGEIYDTIEFFTSIDGNGRGVHVAKNTTLDSLSFKYLATGIGSSGTVTIRNCTVEYSGGIVQGYSKTGFEVVEGDDGEWRITRCGEGISTGGSDCVVTNNYIAYSYDFGLSVENYADRWLHDPVGDWAYHNVTVSGNLVEYAGGGLACASWDAMALGASIPMFDNICYADNYVLYTSMGWSHWNYEEAKTYLASVVASMHPGNSGQVKFENNVFYDCRDISQLVMYEYFDDDKAAVIFHGNTYVANADSRITDVRTYTVVEDWVDRTHYDWLYASNASWESIAQYLGDTDANVIVKNMKFAAQR